MYTSIGGSAGKSSGGNWTIDVARSVTPLMASVTVLHSAVAVAVGEEGEEGEEGDDTGDEGEANANATEQARPSRLIMRKVARATYALQAMKSGRYVTN